MRRERWELKVMRLGNDLHRSPPMRGRHLSLLHLRSAALSTIALRLPNGPLAPFDLHVADLLFDADERQRRILDPRLGPGRDDVEGRRRRVVLPTVLSAARGRQVRIAPRLQRWTLFFMKLYRYNLGPRVRSQARRQD